MTMTVREAVITPEAVRQEMAEITQATALAVGPWIGQDDKLAADGAAVEAMVHRSAQSEIVRFEVVIGEGEKDGAPMLVHGQVLGNGPVLMDQANDPIEGTSRTAEGRDGAAATKALGEKGSFLPWIPGVPYMQKIVTGPEAACLLGSVVGIDQDPRENLRSIASRMGLLFGELRVALLDRPRNQEIVDAINAIGATAILLDSGDMLPAIQTCDTRVSPENREIHVLYGSGGSPEAVLTAAAVAGLGGNMLAQVHPQDTAQQAIVDKLDYKQRGGGLKELIGEGDVFFSATGITDSALMDGLVFNPTTKTWGLGKNPTLTTFRKAIA